MKNISSGLLSIFRFNDVSYYTWHIVYVHDKSVKPFSNKLEVGTERLRAKRKS